MALIFFPEINVLEYFDPSGHTQNIDGQFLQTLLEEKLNSRIVLQHQNTKQLNLANHCNTWSLVYHRLRFNTYDLDYTEFNKKHIKRFQDEIHVNFTNENTPTSKINSSIKAQKMVLHNFHTDFSTKQQYEIQTKIQNFINKSFNKSTSIVPRRSARLKS